MNSTEIRTKITKIRRRQGPAAKQLRDFQVRQEVVDLVVTELKIRGTFYQDGQAAYYFHEADHALMPIEEDTQLLRRVLTEWGIPATDQLFRHVIELVRQTALTEGAAVTVRRFSHYHQSTNTLYVDAGGGEIMKVTTNGAQSVNNGTDGVLFLGQAPTQAWPMWSSSTEMLPIAEVLTGGLIFDESDLTATEQRQLLMLWFYGLFFPELFPNKPILAAIGPAGSGKSSLLRKIDLYLFGEEFQVNAVPSRGDGVEALLAAFHLVVLDNADQNTRALNDLFASASTGSQVAARRLYTTNTVAIFRLSAYIALTSRTPQFRREDMSDRLLPLKLQRLTNCWGSEAELQGEVRRQRAAFLLTVTSILSQTLRGMEPTVSIPRTHEARMADLSAFAQRVGFALDGERGRLAYQALVAKLSPAQGAFSAEDDPLVDLIDQWMRIPGNAGREVLPEQFLRELRDVAARNGTTLEFKTPQELSRQLEDRRLVLERLYGMERLARGSRRRPYRFTLPAAPEASEE